MKNDLKKTSVNIPLPMYQEIDNFAARIGFNRNAAIIYLIARGFNYERDCDRYMFKKLKKIDDAAQEALANSITKKMHERAHRERYDNFYRTLKYILDDMGVDGFLELLDSCSKEWVYVD